VMLIGSDVPSMPVVAIAQAGVAIDASERLANGSNGRTVIVYRTDGVSGVGAGVWGRGFNADGSQLYLWFLIASGDATSPSIDMNADGMPIQC